MHGPIFVSKNAPQTGIYDLITAFYTLTESHPFQHLREIQEVNGFKRVKHASIQAQLAIADYAYRTNVTQSLRVKCMYKAGLFILPSGANFELLNTDMQRSCLIKLPEDEEVVEEKPEDELLNMTIYYSIIFILTGQ